MEEQVVVQAWYVPILGTLAVAILGVVGHYLRKLINSLLKRMEIADNEKEAIQALLDGMAKQQPFIKEIKAASADGKLTRDEAKKFEDAAWAYAKSIAAEGPIRDLVMKWSAERVSSLIKQLLSKFKSTSKVSTPKKPE